MPTSPSPHRTARSSRWPPSSRSAARCWNVGSRRRKTSILTWLRLPPAASISRFPRSSPAGAGARPTPRRAVPKRSAGLLLYRQGEEGLEVLLAHPGGPYYVHKDEGVWTVPKGEYDADEDALDAAVREFTEEMGSPPPDRDPTPLG